MDDDDKAVSSMAANGDADIVALAADLEAGRLDGARRLFHEQGARAPAVLWNPAPVDVGHPAMRAFMRLCRETMGDEAILRADAIDLSMQPAIDRWLIVVRPEDDGHFRYERYGPGIAEHYGRDMTGHSTRDFPGHISQFFTALYRAALARRQVALSEHEPPHQVFVRRWRRLVTPLYNRDDSPWGLAVVNIADNDMRLGLEALPDPVILCHDDGAIAFANAAAERLFGPRSFAGGGVSFAEYTGLDMAIGGAGDGEGRPDDAGPLIQTREIGARRGLIVHFEVTRSTVLYRDRRFWVLVVRPS